MLVDKIIFKKIMREKKEKLNIILCGGGTGGHIFPMISIADQFMKKNNDNKILFVGSRDRMEMQIVPKYNYPIIGLWISGIKRSSFILNLLFIGIPFLIKNFSLPFKLVSSVIRSIVILLKNKPDIVIGFGGYSSGPFLYVASLLNYKTAIQEQNSFPGYTNKILSRRVDLIFVAYDNLKKVMTNKNIFNFGNPLRKLSLKSNEDAFSYFNINRNKKTILVLGGSLGAKSINEGILNNLSLIRESSFQIIWQTGNYYYDEIISQNLNEDNLIIKPFIQKMNLAYYAADLIISRAGAIAISELCVVSKPLILIPSPNVVDDHQNKNAEEIFDKGGCIIINDLDAKEIMLKESIALLEDKRKMDLMSESLKKLSKPNASHDIVNKVYEIL